MPGFWSCHSQQRLPTHLSSVTVSQSPGEQLWLPLEVVPPTPRTRTHTYAHTVDVCSLESLQLTGALGPPEPAPRAPPARCSIPGSLSRASAVKWRRAGCVRGPRPSSPCWVGASHPSRLCTGVRPALTPRSQAPGPRDPAAAAAVSPLCAPVAALLVSGFLQRPHHTPGQQSWSPPVLRVAGSRLSGGPGAVSVPVPVPRPRVAPPTAP